MTQASAGPATRLGRAVDEEGGAVNANAVIVFPIVVLIVMALVQWGLYFHGQHLVDAAAQDAARATQDVNGTPADGQAVAEQLLAAERGSGLLRDVTVDITNSNGTVRVAVHARLRSLVPLPFVTDLHGEAQGPAERFVSEPNR